MENDTSYLNSQSLIPVLKELSDIKSSLTANTVETTNIKSSIGEIKIDLREMKNESVGRREFTDVITGVKRQIVGVKEELEAEISPLKKVVYGLVGLILTGVVVAILRGIIK